MEHNLKRYRYIDYFKALSMVLVVLGHINFANGAIKAWIYAFHMPAFFFASGMLMNIKGKHSLKQAGRYSWKKFKCIMFPFFFWGMIYSSLETHNLVNILYGSHYSLSIAGSLTSLWFLPVLFIDELMFIAVNVIVKEKFNSFVKIILIFAAIAIARLIPFRRDGYPWGIDVAIVAFVFFLLGNVLHPFILKLHDIISDSISSIIISVGFLFVSIAGTLLYNHNIPARGYIMMANADYGQFPLFILVACFGIAFLLLLSLLMDIAVKSKTLDSLFSFIGRNTLPIFAIQKPIIKIFAKLFSMIRVYNYIALIITCIGTFVISCVITQLLNRYIPLMTGHDVRIKT